jgi:hypothetical protein
LLTPSEKLADRQGVRHPGVAISYVRGEELNEALARFGTGGRNRSWQRFDAYANERQRRCDHIGSGQNYEFLGHFRHVIYGLTTLAFCLS